MQARSDSPSGKFGRTPGRALQRILFWVSAALLAGSCTTTTVESFVKVQGSRVTEAYVKRGVDFSVYTSLKPFPLEIYYHEGQGAPDAQDLERIRTIYREAFLAEIGDDYPLVAEAAADALGVRASLVDAKINPAISDAPAPGRLSTLVTKGQLTFFMELTDSVSGEVLARAADKEKEPDEPLDGTPDANWQEVEAAAKRWAGIFRDFLDESLGP